MSIGTVNQCSPTEVVRVKETGQEILIKCKDFDEAKFERIEDTPDKTEDKVDKHTEVKSEGKTKPVTRERKKIDTD